MEFTIPDYILRAVAKRAFDFIAALVALIVLSPLLLLIALAVKMDSRGPVFFRGARVGRGGKPFCIFKFRSMRADADQIGSGITVRADPRITRVGKFLRRTKFDELPQLLNVVRGEMSLVGPRPEDPRWVARYSPEQRQVLSIRPGITSLASLRYRREEELLGSANWEQTYAQRILPDKLALDLEYLRTQRFWLDLWILLLTGFSMLPTITPKNKISLWVYRYVPWGVIDIAIVVGSYGLGFFVRALSAPLDATPAIFFVMIAVVIYLFSNWLWGIYLHHWRYANGQDAIYIFGSTISASLVMGGIDSLYFAVRPIPLSVFLIGAAFVVIFSATARFHRRLLNGVSVMMRGVRGRGGVESKGERAMIVGAGEDGQLLAWQLQNRIQGKAYDLVAFVDDDLTKQGMFVHTTRVLGTRDDIVRLCEKLDIGVILIAMDPGKINNPRQLLEICRSTHAQIKLVPGLQKVLSARDNPPMWEEAREETLLNRRKFSVNDEACRALLAGKLALVTGACGSIGSELSRQIAAYAPAYLFLLDNNETGLHDLALELNAHYPDVQKRLILGDISDAARMQMIFQSCHPQVVFHAAAYKHVPMLEVHPYEAVRVNVLGTQNLYKCAQTFGVERFIFISSDKAVNPTNTLGLTKRIGELMVVRNGASRAMLSTAVRFGNVLGSRGSVIPTFTRQIDNGGPVTITDPEMTRYFLSTSEAVSLVIQAATLTTGGDIFILNMGEEVRILDLARRLIRMRGLRPDVDIKIQIIGARPGEKLREELIGAHEVKSPTAHEAIWRIQDQRVLAQDQFEPRLATLLKSLDQTADLIEWQTRLRAVLDTEQAIPAPATEPAVSLSNAA